MKKVILPPDILTVLVPQHSFLDRGDMQIFTADSNEEALDIHRQEKVNLIIAHFSRQGLGSERFCSLIRDDSGLSRVSIIILCADIPSDIEECSTCRASAIVTRPLDTRLLLEKAQELLSVSSRASYRVLLGVSVHGMIGNAPFFCRSVNISATGMLIETVRTLARGDTVTCSFFLPSGMQIKTAAEVVRAVGPARESGAGQYGLKFIQLTPEVKHALQAFVEEKIQQTDAPAP